MALIDIGSSAISGTEGSGIETYISKTNPANDTGKITEIKAYAYSTNALNVDVATFYSTGTNQFSTRDTHLIGTVVIGSVQTFSGLDIEVETGDYIGFYNTAGYLAKNTSGGAGYWYLSGDHVPCTTTNFSLSGNSFHRISLYGTGTTVEAPTVTTQSCTDIEKTTATGNGNITATGGANCTRRGFCYMEGDSGDPTTANDVVYDDGDFGTGAFSKAITGLDEGTDYRVRAYAINSAGTGYGATVQVKTLIEVNVLFFGSNF